ncbi:hypothetical protein ACEYYB_00745 [Paracoccus sp. p4-l81]|uniref:hypothetical protein n=1 Tax=unclassified Paracoccus (in: a-proteobacteria) TaxID=2688777 RepID=UPI0035BB231D
MKMFTMMAAVAALMALAGCNTVAGVGQDITAVAQGTSGAFGGFSGAGSSGF